LCLTNPNSFFSDNKRLLQVSILSKQLAQHPGVLRVGDGLYAGGFEFRT
jgi:hypothetical protein